jgi:hypothetical protein
MMTTRQILTAATILVPALALAQPARDHLTCFKIKDSVPKAKYQATLTNEAGSQTCIVKTPATFACVETAKSDVTPTPPGGGPSGSAAGSFLCYKAKCPKPTGSTNIQDQFGTRVVKFKSIQWLCAPGSVTPPAPGLPTTTTTTLPGGGGACTFSNGKCTGSCGAGQRCGAVVGSASCECRNVACGDADAPSCNGACSNSSEACVFNLTGCSCVRVP